MSKWWDYRCLNCNTEINRKLDDTFYAVQDGETIEFSIKIHSFETTVEFDINHVHLFSNTK